MTSPVAARLFAGAGLGWGALLLARPRQLALALAPEYPADRDPVIRVLGARVVVQAVAVLVRPSSGVLTAAAAVEAVHAASMGAVAAASPRYRRAALISGAVAAVSAGVAGALARR
jgi:hypothetical protein